MRLNRIKHHAEIEDKFAMLLIGIPSIISLLGAVIFFSVNSLLDLKSRLVPNNFILGEIVISVFVVVISGRLLSQMTLHIFSLLIALGLGYLLFKIGALGGGDVKTVVVISLISPGIEPTTGVTYLLEAILGFGVPLVIALFVGELYVRYYRGISEHKTNLQPALIPYLFGGYLLLQLLGLFL